MLNVKALDRSVITKETLRHVFNDDSVIKVSCTGFHKELDVYKVTTKDGNVYTMYVHKDSVTNTEKVILKDFFKNYRR